MIPVVPQNVLNNAKAVWKETIAKWGREITLHNADNSLIVGPIKAFCKRPKILGLWDRAEQSYDQERYMVMIDVDDLGSTEPEKFMRARWDDEDHAFISVTKVDLMGVVFGYRILVKG
jgi:hypothetical protein